MNNLTTPNVGGSDLGVRSERAGHIILRYGLVVILLWVGLLKFTAYEAKGIEPLVSNSPLMSWGYRVMSMRGFAGLIGVTEILIGLLIATRSVWPRVSALGSLWAIGMFLINLTFVLSTPGVWQDGYGFPFPSPMPGQFLLKDLILLGVAVWSFGEALNTSAVRTARGNQALSTHRSAGMPPVV